MKHWEAATRMVSQYAPTWRRMEDLDRPTTDIPRKALYRMAGDCYRALAGLRPEAVREMREALVAFKAWMDEWYSIRGEVKITASTSPEDNALSDIYDMACAALKAAEED